MPWPPGLCCGELELSLSTVPKGIQVPAGDKARRGTQLVAGVEWGRLGFGSVLAELKLALKIL